MRMWVELTALDERLLCLVVVSSQNKTHHHHHHHVCVAWSCDVLYLTLLVIILPLAHEWLHKWRMWSSQRLIWDDVLICCSACPVANASAFNPHHRCDLLTALFCCNACGAGGRWKRPCTLKCGGLEDDHVTAGGVTFLSHLQEMFNV